jgi:hypothetical protein
MPQYTTSEIQLWISRANKALYKLGIKSTDERFFENDNAYERERLLIYILKKAVSWSYQSLFLAQDKKDRAVSLLINRISIYDFGKQLPIYNTGASEFIGLNDDFLTIPPSPGGGGGGGGSEEPLPDDIILIGGVDITAGLTSFSDSRILGMRIRLVRNGINFYDWFKGGDTVNLTGIGDVIQSGEVFVIQFY